MFLRSEDVRQSWILFHVQWFLLTWLPLNMFHDDTLRSGNWYQVLRVRLKLCKLGQMASDWPVAVLTRSLHLSMYSAPSLTPGSCSRDLVCWCVKRHKALLLFFCTLPFNVWLYEEVEKLWEDVGGSKQWKSTREVQYFCVWVAVEYKYNRWESKRWILLYTKILGSVLFSPLSCSKPTDWGHS